MFNRQLSLSLSYGQGRIRTSVARKERQIYSLLPLTARPPVRTFALMGLCLQIVDGRLRAFALALRGPPLQLVMRDSWGRPHERPQMPFTCKAP